MLFALKEILWDASILYSSHNCFVVFSHLFFIITFVVFIIKVGKRNQKSFLEIITWSEFGAL